MTWSDYASSPSGQLEYCLEEKHSLKQALSETLAQLKNAVVLLEIATRQGGAFATEVREEELPAMREVMRRVEERCA